MNQSLYYFHYRFSCYSSLNLFVDLLAKQTRRLNQKNYDKTIKILEEMRRRKIVYGSDKAVELADSMLDLDDQQTIAKLEQLQCMIAPANATLRALRPTSFKTVDDPDAQGVIIQPKVNMGVRCLSGNSLKCVFSGEDWADATTALATVKEIYGAISGKFKLPNLSYDEDLPVAAAGTLTSTAQGAVTKA